VQPLITLKLEYIEIPLLVVKVNRVLSNYFAARYFVSNLKSYKFVNEYKVCSSVELAIFEIITTQRM